MSVGKTKAGTWYCKFYYNDYKGERHQVKKEGFKLKRDAQQYEADFKAKYNGGASMPFSSLADIYLEQFQEDVNSGKKKQATYDKRKRQIELHIKPFFTNTPINEITPNTIRIWQNEVKTNLSPITQRLLHGYLSTIFKFACQYYDLQVNPCRLVDAMGNLKQRKEPDKIHYWTVEQFDSFITALYQVRSTTPHDMLKTGYLIFFYGGLRIGELMALTVSDYDPNKHTLRITESMNPAKDVTDPKTEKSKRTITMPISVCECLDKHLRQLQNKAPDGLLFPFSRTVFQNNITKVSKYAKLPTITIHDLRHSHATLLINGGVNPLAVSERLGHENVEITLKTYSHLYKKTADNVADFLENCIKK